MKVAIVWNHGSPLSACSFRFEEYVRGLERLGHEATVVCPISGDDGLDVPLTLARDAEEMLRVELWQRIGAEVAIIPTFHQMTDLLRAVRAAETRIVAIGDSDGQRGLRVFPYETMRSMVLADGDRRAQLARTRQFVRRWWRSLRTLDPQDAAFIESTRLSDVVALASRGAIANFRHFLEVSGAGDLAGKLCYVPLAIHRLYLEWEGVGPKQRELVAVGRFGSPQKNGPLLARTLERVLRSENPPEKVTIFDAGGSPALQSLARRFPQVTWSPPQPPHVLAAAHSTARSILVSSRWEGSPPHAAWEAAAMGATVISTPIPAFRSWSEEGPYGTIASSHSSRALAAAVEQEMRAWDEGRRDASAIAAHWRAQASGENVVETMLRALREVQASSPL